MEKKKMIYQKALRQMSEKSLSADFQAQVMERVREKAHRRELIETWCICITGCLLLIGVGALTLWACHQVAGEIFTEQNIYTIKLICTFGITLLILYICDELFRAPILAFLKKIDPN